MPTKEELHFMLRGSHLAREQLEMRLDELRAQVGALRADVAKLGEETLKLRADNTRLRVELARSHDFCRTRVQRPMKPAGSCVDPRGLYPAPDERPTNKTLGASPAEYRTLWRCGHDDE